jgi:hypothetical protein
MTLVTFQILSKIREIFTSQGAPLVSTTPVANFAACTAGVVDTGGKFVTGVNNTGGKLEQYQTADIVN